MENLAATTEIPALKSAVLLKLNNHWGYTKNNFAEVLARWIKIKGIQPIELFFAYDGDDFRNNRFSLRIIYLSRILT